MDWSACSSVVHKNVEKFKMKNVTMTPFQTCLKEEHMKITPEALTNSSATCFLNIVRRNGNLTKPEKLYSPQYFAGLKCKKGCIEKKIKIMLK